MFPSLTMRAHAEAVRPCFLRKRPMEGRLRVPLSDRIHCPGFPDGADDGVRTRGFLLGKQACCHCTTSAWTGLLNGVEPYPLRPERGGVLFHTWEPRLRCEGWDSNPRPPGYEPGELPSCSTPHGRAFFRIRRTAVTCCPPAERGMAGFRVNVRGLHAGWGLDACVRQRSSTLLASGHGCVDSAGRRCRSYCPGILPPG